MSQTLFDLHQGTVPLLISIPHLGTQLPAEISAAFSPEAAIVSDTDWHLDRLYTSVARWVHRCWALRSLAMPST